MNQFKKYFETVIKINKRTSIKKLGDIQLEMTQGDNIIDLSGDREIMIQCIKEAFVNQLNDDKMHQIIEILSESITDDLGCTYTKQQIWNVFELVCMYNKEEVKLQYEINHKIYILGSISEKLNRYRSL